MDYLFAFFGKLSINIRINIQHQAAFNSFPASGDFCNMLMTFTNSFGTDKDRQNVCLGLDQIQLTP